MKLPDNPVELAKLLVSIPSVSPEGETGGTRAGEAAMAACVADVLRALGGEVTVEEVQPGRPNVIGRFAASTHNAPTLALVPHLDTVGVAGMTVAPFDPVVRDGRLFGRGSVDTKGPMAAALWGLRQWLQSPGPRRLNVLFVATMGEEELSVGAKALCHAGFKADFAIALEPTELNVVRAAKGVLRLWVQAKGRAAHGSTPERGLNAIYRMADFLTACRDRLSPAFAAARHETLGGASLNVGLVRGGSELNIVADHCVTGLDIRTHSGFDNDAALEAVRQEAAGMDVSIHRRGEPFDLPSSHPWVRQLVSHAQGELTVPWFSDANVFNAFGIPAVAFGPGSISQAHTAAEYIETRALEEGAAVFARILDGAGG
ncbi:MAG TPA: M20/M25/M40 family metallo-hydrolase [Opitutaceae bacterium]